MENVFKFYDYRVYEKIMEKLKEIGQSVTGVKRKMANWAKGVALQGNINLEQGYVWTWKLSIIMLSCTII